MCTGRGNCPRNLTFFASKIHWPRMRPYLASPFLVVEGMTKKRDDGYVLALAAAPCTNELIISLRCGVRVATRCCFSGEV